MTPQPSLPFYGTSGSPSGSAPPNGSPQRMALDNIIRRELRVSDPNDPIQIAQALLTRYKDSPRAQAISQEAKGLPFLQAAPMQALVPQAATSSDAELQQARDDVDRDLHELTTNSLLKDVTPELQGWAQAVRSAITEGTAAARFALDPRQRDKAFGIRRQLGDYARIARLVGALTPTLSLTYRKFAQSLDEVAAVILVTMGEALSNVGFSGGRFLLQAPFSELQVRRDTAIYALRNLIGATQDAFGPNDWPRGLDAYRALYRFLEVQGQGDLRSLLVENELARIMDELIQRAAHGRAEGLRALGATAQLDLERFRRLVAIGQRAVSPESPTLTAFLQALQLFVDAFESSGGFRLIRIARPPITLYGLYGLGGLEDADQRLLQLTIQRGVLADKLDCFLQCDCGPTAVICQVILDKILYDVDRAIDLYALGKEDFGRPERRAAAYGYVIEAFRAGDLASAAGCAVYPRQGAPISPNNEIGVILDEIEKELRPALDTTDPDVDAVINDLVSFAGRVRATLASTGLCDDTVDPNDPNKTLCDAIGDPPVRPSNLDGLTDLFRLAKMGEVVLTANNIQTPTPSIALEAFLGILQQELCIQREMEAGWENLVKSMAPSCVGFSTVFNALQKVIEDAIDLVSGTDCPPITPSIPPHFETSLDSIVDDVDRIGRNRPQFNDRG